MPPAPTGSPFPPDPPREPLPVPGPVPRLDAEPSQAASPDHGDPWNPSGYRPILTWAAPALAFLVCLWLYRSPAYALYGLALAAVWGACLVAPGRFRFQPCFPAGAARAA